MARICQVRAFSAHCGCDQLDSLFIVHQHFNMTTPFIALSQYSLHFCEEGGRFCFILSVPQFFHTYALFRRYLQGMRLTTWLMCLLGWQPLSWEDKLRPSSTIRLPLQPNLMTLWPGRYTVHSSLCVCGLKPLYVLLYQGLASYYDKHPPSAQGEVEDALQTYQTLLPHITRYMSTLICQNWFLRAVYIQSVF